MRLGFIRTLLELPPLPDPIRRSFRREQFTQLMLPPAFALMEGGIVGVIADKIYHVQPWMLAVITAAPMFGNLMSFLWSRVALARPKVPLISAIQLCVLLCIGAVAFLPTGEGNGLLLALCVVASRLLMAGVTTVRSVVWSLNYARELRARTTGRLQIISNLITATSSLCAGFALDADPNNFRYVYALGVLFGLCGVIAFSGVRVQSESRHLVKERASNRGDSTAASIGFFSILRDDRYYRRYQLYQFVSGFSAMMMIPSMIHLISHELMASYLISFLLMGVVPLILSVLTMPLWSYFLDRVHVTEFRARQSILWIIEFALMWVGALLGSLWVIAAARVTNGISAGAGNLAWELGHNDFAPKDRVGAYMSVHVTLTGVRGATAPFLGTALYHGWSVIGFLPAFGGISAHLFAFTTLLAAWSWRGFNNLALDMKAMRNTLTPPA